MLIAGLVLAAVAAIVHVYIFVLESFQWTGTRARAIFGTTPDEAQQTRALAFNQGFYNLFLAVAVVLGIILIAGGQREIGATLVFSGAGSMAAAATVLLLSSPDKAGSALKQGLIPLAAVILTAIGLI